jgi:hypothetical protein
MVVSLADDLQEEWPYQRILAIFTKIATTPIFQNCYIGQEQNELQTDPQSPDVL